MGNVAETSTYSHVEDKGTNLFQFLFLQVLTLLSNF